MFYNIDARLDDNSRITTYQGAIDCKNTEEAEEFMSYIDKLFADYKERWIEYWDIPISIEIENI